MLWHTTDIIVIITGITDTTIVIIIIIRGTVDKMFFTNS